MAEAKKKENLFARIGRWLREMRSELKKVVWPSRSQVIKNTLIVIACAVIFGIVVWVFDLVASQIVQAIIKLFV